MLFPCLSSEHSSVSGGTPKTAPLLLHVRWESSNKQMLDKPGHSRCKVKDARCLQTSMK